MLHRILEHLAGFEADRRGGFDVQRLARHRVATHAGGALFLGEGAEADDRHRVVVLDTARDAVNDSLDRAGGGRFGSPRSEATASIRSPLFIPRISYRLG